MFAALHTQGSLVHHSRCQSPPRSVPHPDSCSARTAAKNRYSLSHNQLLAHNYCHSSIAARTCRRSRHRPHPGSGSHPYNQVQHNVLKPVVIAVSRPYRRRPSRNRTVRGMRRSEGTCARNHLRSLHRSQSRSSTHHHRSPLCIGPQRIAVRDRSNYRRSLDQPYIRGSPLPHSRHPSLRHS